VIDTATNMVVATVPVGNVPSGVAITPDGTHVYVANSNPGTLGTPGTPGTPGTVSVIAAASNTVVATVGVGANPSGVAVTPDGTHVYVTNPSSVIATATNTVVATVTVGIVPIAVGIMPPPVGVPSSPSKPSSRSTWTANQTRIASPSSPTSP
jgi:YVTN family beta-propeller protein